MEARHLQSQTGPAIIRQPRDLSEQKATPEPAVPWKTISPGPETTMSRDKPAASYPNWPLVQRGTKYPHITFESLSSGAIFDLPLSLRLRIQATRYKNVLTHPTKSRRLLGAGLGSIIPLPNNKILKLNASRNELHAMEFVRANTTIPLPTIFVVYVFPQSSQPENSVDHERIHMIMSHLPGSNQAYVDMSESQIREYGKQLAGCLAQLRCLEPPAARYVGSVTGQSLIDHRLGHIPFGPFATVAEFHDYLRLGGKLENWTGGDIVKTVHGRNLNLDFEDKESEKTVKGYITKFTHADLNPSNIMYDGQRITGIIDWEFAGFYPEYWEYTKMYFAEGRPAYANFFSAVEREDSIAKYREELEAENDIQERVSFWRYDDYYGGSPTS
ncbi:hypothetical protein V8F20_008669 [Naviculisporaceae sp. PSN 640]